MNTDSLSFAINAVSNVVNFSLSKKQYKQQLEDIKKVRNALCSLNSTVTHNPQFLEKFGFECERHLYRCLFQSALNTPYSDTNRLSLLQQLYSDVGSVFSKTNFVTLVRFSLRPAETERNTQNDDCGINTSLVNTVNEVCKCLKLTETDKFTFFFAFNEYKCCEQNVDLSQCYFSTSSELTHSILTQLYVSADPVAKTIADNIVERVIRIVVSGISISVPVDQKESSTAFLHSPFCDSLGMESSVSSAASTLTDDQIANMLVNESGVQLSSDILRQFNVTPKLCAKLLFVLCEHSRQPESGLQRQLSDDIDQFANLCREFILTASPLIDIIQAIDTESCVNNTWKMSSNKFGKSPTPFSRFWQFCVNLCNTDKQGISILGVLFFGKLWNYNVEFQFSVVVNCIKNQLVSKLLSAGPSGTVAAGSDISQVVPHLESLKCQPDFESNLELCNWKYQKVYQILMDLSIANASMSSPNQTSVGTMFYGQIMELFKWPLQQCPDLVTLGLLGCFNNPSLCKNDILNMAVPAFLSNHPNAAIILHTIWTTPETGCSATTVNNNQWAKQVLLQSMCEYYMKSPVEEQQQRLSRILDVAQDLKALSLLLNSNCYPFVIDLACLASRREYLKLDKWLTDKIQSNGESFITACVAFLNRRCSALLVGAKALESAPTPITSNLPSETLATMLACLHNYIVSSAGSNVANISQDISETILTMVANSSLLLQKVPRQPPPGVISNPTVKPTLGSSSQAIGDLGLNNMSLSSSANTSFNQNRLPFNTSLPPASQAVSSPAVGNQQSDRLRQVVGDLSNIFPEMPQNVSPEIEQEADSYFQRIYNQSSTTTMSIDEVLEMLKKFQDSNHKRERDVFACMIRNLFKEYCYFPQYPDKELLITAQLFGGIIQMGLVKYMGLVIALRYVLEALRKPYASKMYYFGITALDRFKTKLKEYPLYCQHLASIPHFRDFPAHLLEYIEYGRQDSGMRVPQQSLVSSSTPPPTNAGLPQPLANSLGSGFGNPIGVGVIGSLSDMTNHAPIGSMSSQTPTKAIVISTGGVIGQNLNSGTSAAIQQNSSSNSSRPSIANATNIDTLLAAGETMYQTPPENIQDKVAFIVNNISQVNLAQKSEEFKDVIGKDDIYYGWVAQYFVMKRASIEPNFHTLYANLIEMLKLPELTKLVIRETYRNIKVLLRSDKEIANFSDRSLLKNLGHWLGMLTLAKNKAILAIDLNLKDLLIEAYHKGTQELLYVVPFIAKILESCAKSKVFKPPNPWTMGIVKALVELHQEPSLKLNLKFEVEVLCKTLNLDINDLCGKSNILKDDDAAHRVMLEQQLAGGAKAIQQIPQTSQPIPVSTQTSQLSQPSIPQQTPIPQAQIPLSLSLSLPQSQQQTLPSLLQPSVEHSISHHSTSPTVQLGMTQQVSAVPPISMTPTPSSHLFNYHDLNVSSIAGLAPHIVISNNLPLLQHNVTLKQFIRPTIERAVQEWIQPVVERSIKISLTTAEQIIKKDFALESDENKMCLAAQYLVRNLTAGMAMITSKETLFVTITTALITAFTRNSPQTISKDLIEATANTIASDNIDLACSFIQKSAIEKAIPELDKRLAHEYELRRKARNEGRRYCDPSVLTYQAERMPEAIRLKVGSVTTQQFQVYEELGKNIPGFIAPISDAMISGINSVVTTSGQSSIRNIVSNNSAIGQPFVQNMGSNVNSTLTTGTATLSNSISVPLPPSLPNFSTDSTPVDSALIALYDKVVAELEQLLQQFVQSMQPPSLMSTMHSILEAVINSRNNPRDFHVAVNLIQRVVDALGELVINADSGVVEIMLLMRARDLYLVLGDGRAFGHQWCTKQVTKIVLERLLSQTSQTPPLPDELFDILIRSLLINVGLMDMQLARMIEATQSPLALAFTLQFIKIYGPQGIHENEVPNIIAALIKISKNAGASNPLSLEIHQILESLRGGTSQQQTTLSTEVSTFQMQANNQTRDYEADSPEFMEKTERLLREWINLYHSTANINKVFHMYVQSMNQQGILKTDDSITRFFRLSTELCVEFSYRILNAQQSQNNQAAVEVRTKCFNTLDAFAHLIVMLVKYSGTNTGTSSESTAKLSLLTKVLGIIANVVCQDQELRNENFQHLAYYRILIILFMELTLGPNNLGFPGLQSLQHQLAFGAVNSNHLDQSYDNIQFQVLNAFYQTLRILKPSKVPSFAFAWLDFISHRTFMEKCLNGPNSVNTGISTKGWSLYAQLLIEIIKFESPFLRNVELPQSVDLLYKGTLKVLLILLHDFPEFLCEYCYELCDAIPCNAIQMRNLVLSAFPRNMRLPDPFTPNLKIDSLQEITQPPKGTTTTLAALANVSFKKDLESYIRTRSPVTFLSELRGYLQIQSQQSQPGDSTIYNIPLINALVLYVGQAAIQTITPKNISMSTIAHSSHMDIFQNLAVDLDTSGKVKFLVQYSKLLLLQVLRYPNSHTHYFSCALLYLFAESNTEAIQEQITRVLLERLIVNRPHPWGLLVTFIELIKNPAFKFWNHEFVRCAPEIEKLFESVARSCMQQQQKSHTTGNAVQATADGFFVLMFTKFDI
ncbi:CCR4-NOT transcription complex subunit 1-like isoform X6 [Leptotrombidium deliense]|uniref:CCR4-NOT transcription complex subunit 1-like isoform X6 n=1 Tax=Leptotrombidium deliense TaxID=299467 RepID=A0A443SPW9_9ACAR|nr:CCR4-NOT transcription complex subunit 1-like isoform X6 [Leptotrombidium deliense]